MSIVAANRAQHIPPPHQCQPAYAEIPQPARMLVKVPAGVVSQTQQVQSLLRAFLSQFWSLEIDDEEEKGQEPKIATPNSATTKGDRRTSNPLKEEYATKLGIAKGAHSLERDPIMLQKSQRQSLTCILE
ncbi:Uncharacterized protein Fot_38679 [Forsythia ovata]|uniref:Uncharacterized protein n=1 Tax=Forsythia ovata TaxID=205694 RepID=A0ABD1S2I4_9LAMI